MRGVKTLFMQTKTIYIKSYLSILLLLLYVSTSFAQTSLSGKITDSKDKTPLPGATVYFPDLKIGAATNADGVYQINNLPKGKFTVSVKYIGYSTLSLSIDLAGVTDKDFELSEGVIESKEFIVTGVSQATEKNRTPTPITLVPKTALLQSSSTNIIDALAKQPGISQLSTGQGISKPVIRGLGYNRVVVVNDGIRQEGQQWGDEHGIEIDEFSVNNVEILKGPASLAYGSDAMAGVINFISAPTANAGEINGNIIANYQTNNKQIAYSGNIAGNIKDIIWDARFSQKKTGNYRNSYDGKVFNTAFNETDFNGIIGVNKKWGYSHLHVGYYHLNLGIAERERDSASGKFLKEVANGDTAVDDAIANTNDLNGYKLFNPRQNIIHTKAVLNNNFVIGSGRLALTLGFQQNQRQELADVLHPNQYGLYFLLNTINYDVKYILPEKNNWNIAFGVNGMQQTSQNKGIEFLVPDYSLLDAGVFVTAKKAIDKLDISGGLRYDNRSETGKELFLDTLDKKTSASNLFATQKFKAFSTSFSGVSGSLGATYQFSEKLFSKLNISRGFRAPNIAELGANGVHEGTIRYELGNANLKPETSLQIDAELGLNTEHVSFEIDFFNNRIKDFIFPVKLAAIAGGDSISEGLQTFKYISGNANLIGGEALMDIHPHPLDWLHFENSFSIVQSVQLNQPDSTKYLPFTPAPKFQSELKANAKKMGKILRNAYAKVEMQDFFAQNNFYAAYGTETATPGYVLFNAGVGTDFVNSKEKTILSFYISANNITDVAYQSHLSRLKYAAENYATGRTGIYNMGRNVSFKVVVPIRIKQNK